MGPQARSTRASSPQRRDPRGVQGNPIMASMLRSIDESLGRVRRGAARQRACAENTIVVLTSDHGGNVRSNLPGYWRAMGQDERRRDGLAALGRRAGRRPATRRLRDGKGSLYEGGVRVPLIVAWPGRVRAPGWHTATWCTSTDLYPTLLDLLGAALRPRRAIRRHRASPPCCATGGAGPQRECIFNFQPNDKAALRPAASVRRGSWKLIRWLTPGPRGAVELYDLEADIGETTRPGAQERRDLACGAGRPDRRLPRPTPAPCCRSPTPPTRADA